MSKHKEIVKGSRVRTVTETTRLLTEKPDSPKFPHWGGKYGHIKGTVVKTAWDDCGTRAVVAWDNGELSDGLYVERLILCDPFYLEAVEYLKLVPAKVCGSKYTKYFIMLATALAIDHFILSGRFRKKFLELGEKLVERSLAIMEGLISKISVDSSKTDGDKKGDV